MAVNSSSSNDSLRYPELPFAFICLFSWPSSKIFTTFCITRILVLLPPCVIVLQRWWRQRSASTAPTMSHSDSFSYHVVTIELIDVSGCILICCGTFADQFNVFHIGNALSYFTWYGETFFNILTCVERYLAVVHPVTYLSLRSSRGVRIRNVTIGFVWLISIGLANMIIFNGPFFFVDACLLILFLIIVTFCSLSVLNVLIHPGPGEQGGDRKRVDQSKRRAFYTIVALLGALLLRSFGSLIWVVLSALKEDVGCEITALMWFNLPCSLVLPLLFLLRAGMLSCCKKNPK